MPELLIDLGHWNDVEKSESSSDILDYFKEALVLMDNGGVMCEAESMMKAYLGLARLADQQYRKIDEYMESAEFKERQDSIKEREKEMEILKNYKQKEVEKAFRQSVVTKERFLYIDKAETVKCKKERDTYLYASISNYLAVMKYGDQSVAIYRMLSLWFANQESAEVNELMAKMLPQIPSYRLVPLLYQMAARMSVDALDKEDSSQKVLYSCLRRCAIEHAPHALPIIFALKNAHVDTHLEKGTQPDCKVKEDSRCRAAKKMLAELENQSEYEEIVQRYSELTVGIAEVAYLVLPKKDLRGPISIPNSKRYIKIKNWANIPVPTDHLPVRPDGDYSCYPGIERFEPVFKFVGGINAPKQTECLGTDGVRRMQMIKGQDDMRQDAVMQQVFHLTNQLLEQDRETRQHQLKIRTYKIVPLSQRSGLLEWCKNTKPIGNILIGEGKGSGMHSKYYPKHLNSNACYKKFQQLKSSRNPIDDFLLICQQFPPAMKYFLLEQFSSAKVHHQARQRFTKSVATTSMVGHILGIGDRHLNNILVDMETAELVHIDFGIAFDKGSILPTPEKVPFRLTRDIVDGLGPTGVEGVFRFVNFYWNRVVSI